MGVTPMAWHCAQLEAEPRIAQIDERRTKRAIRSTCSDGRFMGTALVSRWRSASRCHGHARIGIVEQ
jgi:hypothetical protein